jgi:predicted dienelactone hydrolase
VAAEATTTTTEAPTTTTTAVLPARPLAVASTTRTFVDESRSTPAGGGNPGAPTRTLETSIWYPDAPGRFPLVVFSHGWTASGPQYGPLLEEWVEAGYVVAAPTFPASSGEGGSQLQDYVNQPADVSFVLDSLLADTELADRIDPELIGFAGHSLGGLTALGVTFNDCCADLRVDAAILLAAPRLDFPGGAYFTGQEVPVLMVNGTADELVNYDAFALPVFADAAPPKFLVTIPGGTHVDPFRARASTVSSLVVDAEIAFLDTYLLGDDTGLDRLRALFTDPALATLQEQVA